MGLYNFKPRFVPFILDGSKQHTIRATRAYGETPGNTVHLYTGLRHKGARLLGRYPCVKTEAIVITVDFDIYIDGIRISEDECNALAYRDGFRERGPEHAFEEMKEFWAGRLPFAGQIVHWKWAE